MKHRGRTVLAMDCALAGAERHRGRPLNSVVRFHQVRPPRRTYLIPFMLLGAVAGVVAIIGLHTWAGINIGGATLEAGFNRAVEAAINSWFGSILQVLPFIGAGVLAAETAYRAGAYRGIVLMVLLVSVISWLFHNGYTNAEHALAQGKWTAASLEMGFPVIISVFVLIAGAFVAGGLSWKYGKDET